MSKAIQIQINVDLLDLKKVYKGKKGNYITISGILNDVEDQYGNFGFVKQFVANDNSEMPILGNMKLKEFNRTKVATYDNLPAQNKVQVNNLNEDNDLPF